MTKKQIIITILVALLAAGNAILGVGYYFSRLQIKDYEKQVKVQQTSGKILQFTNLFVNKVLQAQTEVSFDDRLKLENAVRDLNDPQILSQWEKFTNSQTESDAQQQVKNLLALLIKKITY